jgi:hypothetical protein
VSDHPHQSTLQQRQETDASLAGASQAVGGVILALVLAAVSPVQTPPEALQASSHEIAPLMVAVRHIIDGLTGVAAGGTV